MQAPRPWLALAALVLLAPLHAASDTFACSESGLLAAVAAGGGPHGFDCTAPTVVQTAAEIVIASDVSLDGADLLTLDGGDHHRILSIAAGASVALRGLTLTRGNSATGTRWGGAIRNDGTLTLEDVIVSHSRATLRGAAIANTGTLTLRSSQVIKNGIPPSPAPGAPSVQGGIYHQAGRLVIEDSAIEDNLAGAAGGVMSLGALEIHRSRIVRNDSGAITASGVTLIVETTIAENVTGILCGGLWISPGGEATVLRTTVRDNSAGNACGAIGVGGKLLLVNSTISGNRAALRRSGGVDVFDPLATVRIVQSTIVDNEGAEAGGIFAFQGHVVVQGSIVAGNRSPAGVECHTGSTALIESAGGNVFSESGCPAGSDDVVVAGDSVLDTLLGPLATNGGLTSTHLPLAGSAALDLVPDPLCEATPELQIGTDQRGLPRPSDGDRDGVARCDAGAVERVVEAVRIRIRPKLVPGGWRAWPKFPLRVLLFGSERVAVRDVVLDSIAFGPAGAQPLQIPPPRFADVGRNGIEDLFLAFRLRDTGLGVGDTEACITASLPSGILIEGCDPIRVLPPHGRPD